MVSVIPKTAFSSLLVLSFIDMVYNWGIKSYFKTKEKMEWLVVPLIVLLAFVVGLLPAVFLGLAMSTFLFVASFFRSGVVKYLASAITIRSTIERPTNTAKWLDHNGDLIQVIVLQNYLFFGNASSMQRYVASMFEEPEPDIDELLVPPIPKVVIIDLTLVTGIDTSAVDVFAEILNHCGNHNCKLFLSGVSTSLRQVMALGGVKPEMSRDRSKRKLRFFPSLDDAVGKAEDFILDDANMNGCDLLENCGHRFPEKGFQLALRLIDDQHSTKLASSLKQLGKHVIHVQMTSGDVLYQKRELDRGLFFIESGVLVRSVPARSLYSMRPIAAHVFE